MIYIIFPKFEHDRLEPCVGQARLRAAHFGACLVLALWGRRGRSCCSARWLLVVYWTAQASEQQLLVDCADEGFLAVI